MKQARVILIVLLTLLGSSISAQKIETRKTNVLKGLMLTSGLNQIPLLKNRHISPKYNLGEIEIIDTTTGFPDKKAFIFVITRVKIKGKKAIIKAHNLDKNNQSNISGVFVCKKQKQGWVYDEKNKENNIILSCDKAGKPNEINQNTTPSRNATD